MRGKCQEEKLLARAAKKHSVALLGVFSGFSLLNSGRGATRSVWNMVKSTSISAAVQRHLCDLTSKFEESSRSERVV